MKETLVYKVCRKLSRNRFTSTFAEGRFLRWYVIDETTKPVEGTKLFAFKDLEHAKNWQNFHPSFYTILECKATGVKKGGILGCRVGNIDELKRLFTLTPRQYRNSAMDRPESQFASCCFCSSIIPIKEIK